MRVMAIFGTYLQAGRGSEPVWFRGPKTSPKVPVIYGATSGGPKPKLMMSLRKACPPLKRKFDFKLRVQSRTSRSQYNACSNIPIKIYLGYPGINNYIKGAGGYLGVRLWKMSLNTLLIEGVMVVI